MSEGFLYKLGIFTEDDNYAVTLAFQEHGKNENTIKSVDYYEEFSFNKIVEIADRLKIIHDIRSEHFFINNVDIILLKKFKKNQIELQVKEVDEITSINAIKSLLRDGELLFENLSLKEEIETKLKYKFNEIQSKHTLKSIYLACCENVELRGLSLLLLYRSMEDREKKKRETHESKPIRTYYW